MTIEQFQREIDRTYGARDAARGLEATFMWLVEEVGELARALREDDPAAREAEFADVLAWLTTTATLAGVDLQQAAERYADGCPKCGQAPCVCPRGA
ncbi:MAG: nucleotide pyrophosphohydrolase [Armatimonadetes bacterium]|nr:nucleotide pyrophosphohydrolase [Armatimonadota bacterium]